MTDNKCPLGENSSAFARLESKIDSQPSPLTIWQAISVAAGFLVAFFGIWAVASDRFDGGISAYGILDTFVASRAERDAAHHPRRTE